MTQIIVSLLAVLVCVFATRASIIMCVQVFRWTRVNGPGNLRWFVDAFGLATCSLLMLLVTTVATAEALKALGLGL